MRDTKPGKRDATSGAVAIPARCELSEELLVALSAARDQMGEGDQSVSYVGAVVDAKKLRRLLRAAGARPQTGQFRDFRNDLEAALTQYVTDIGSGPFKVVPSKLIAELDEIERAAAHLLDLLVASREAEDLMVRAIRPGLFPANPPFVGPYAPPAFQELALHIRDVAHSAKGLDFDAIPYARAGRDRQAMNRLIAGLIIAWDDRFDDAATFTGGENPSAFVALAQACLVQVGAKTQSSDALAKTCSRIAKKVRTGVAAG
jgi:hypothetical protein